MTRMRPLLVCATIAAAVLIARPALAGPPLLCFPFDIGSARTLPMAVGNWEKIDVRYDVAHLVDDTVALLTPDTPVLVRMETLRRATIYASKHPSIAAALLNTLQARASIPDVNAPLAVFDFGYLVETYREATFMFASPIPAIDRIDGYQLVLKAQALQRDEAMGRAATLIADGRPKAVAALK
jgi:hypothetical protein